jgi:hypothetical protein
MNAPVVVGGDTKQDIFQIRDRRDVGELAALHWRIEQRGARRAPSKLPANSQFFLPTATSGGRILYRAKDNLTAADPIRFDHETGSGAAFRYDAHVEARFDGTVRVFGQARNVPPAGSHEYEIRASLRWGAKILSWYTRDSLPLVAAARHPSPRHLSAIPLLRELGSQPETDARRLGQELR